MNITPFQYHKCYKTTPQCCESRLTDSSSAAYRRREDSLVTSPAFACYLCKVLPPDGASLNEANVAIIPASQTTANLYFCVNII